jgi:putative phosphoesterase
MRIAVISDLHGHIVPLEAVMKDIKKRSVDASVCCGDLAAFGPNPVEVLDLLESWENMQIIRGNTDRWLELVGSGRTEFEELAVRRMQPTLRWTLEKLGPRGGPRAWSHPPSMEMGAEGLRVFVRHGSLDSDTAGLFPDSDLEGLTAALEKEKCDIFLCGHTHVPFTRRAGNIAVVNAGSTAYPFDSVPRPSWVLLEIENKGLKHEIFRVDYNMEAALQGMRSSGMPMADVMIERMRNARM